MDISTDKIMNKLDADENLTLLAAAYQLVSKDVSPSSSFQQMTLTGKVENLADIILGRTIGYQPFNGTYPLQNGSVLTGVKYPATFKLENAINKTSELGAGLWILSEVGLLSSKWGTRGKKILVGGAIGGVFDAPTGAPRGGAGTYSTPRGSFEDQAGRAAALNAQLGGGF